MLEDPENDVGPEDYVYTPSRHFKKAYPQLLIKFYQSCFTLINDNDDSSATTAAAAGTSSTTTDN